MGIGMMFPKVYQQIINSISDGEYGQRWKDLFDSQEYVAVNAKKTVYICRNCGHWETNYILDLYVPKKPEEIPNKRYGIKTVAEWGYVPYVIEYDLKENYKILKHFVHTCTNCGRRTHKASDNELQNLSCPKCGKDNKITGFVNWD